MVNRGLGSISEIRKKLSYNHEYIATCYHEAGHTISGLLNYLVISAVGIEMPRDKRSSKDAGYTHFDYVLDPEDVKNSELSRKLLLSEIQINYAGLAAEKIFYKEICGTDKLPMVLKFGSYLDRDRVAEIIKKYDLAPPGKKRHLYKKKLFNETQRSLEEYWGDVKLISHALFARRKLYYSDLKELLIKKSSKRAFWKKQFKSIEVLFEAAKANDEKFIHDTIYN